MLPLPSPESSLPKLIGKRALRHGDRIATTFLGDTQSEQSWTYAELWSQACEVSRRLPEAKGGQPRALLLYPPGIEFVAALLGCQIAGWIPVPTCYPRGGREMRRLDSVATDCEPSAILGDRRSLDDLQSDRQCEAIRRLPRIATDGMQIGSDAVLEPDSLTIGADDLALLQYTSGSTSDPKGVMVRHRNVMANLEAIREGFQIDWQADDVANPDCALFWLPFFHDMGLIGGILEPLYVGGRVILMSPRSFLQRPIRWLKAISDYGAVISGAPNFAYQLCVDRISPDQTDTLDLRAWRIAFTGAEPVLPRTLHDFSNRFSVCGFSSSAFLPCYGLAEATLLAACVDGPGEPRVLTVDRESLAIGRPRVADDKAPGTVRQKGTTAQRIVSCGRAARQIELLIVDPTTRRGVDAGQVGEIWLRGTSITDGYWQRDDESREYFDAALEDGRKGFCRTGDLGFVHEGDLFVTGRLKDLIIIGGRNLFPQDIEETVSHVVGSGVGRLAAFSVAGAQSEAFAILVELPRHPIDRGPRELVRDIRRMVIEAHEVDPRHVLLVRQATIPVTSSGKVQRGRCRERFDANEIKCLHRYDRHSASSQTPIPIPELPHDPQPSDLSSTLAAIESWMVEWLISRGGVAPQDVDRERPFAEYGLDSMTAVEMSGEIEDWSGVELTPIVAWNHPSVARLSRYIADQLIGEPVDDDMTDDPSLENFLSEIEQIPETEINHALASRRRK